MTEERFKILFRGDIADGFLREDVKAKLIELFGLKEQTVEALLEGQTATLKKNLDRDGALKFKQAFEKTGAICYIRPMDDNAATSAPKPPSTPITGTAAAPPVPPAVDRSEPESFTVVDTRSPAPDAAPEAEQEPEPVFEIPPGPSPGTMRCPKCEFVQPTADFCEACGVVILKYLKREWEQEQLAKQLEATQKETEEAPLEKPAATPEPPPPIETPEVKASKRPEVPPTPHFQQRVERSEPEAFTVVDNQSPSPAAAEEAEQEPEPVFEIPPGPSPGTMRCPKCEFVQPMSDFCEACGVVILKYLKREWEQTQLAKQLEEAQQEASDVSASSATDEAPAPESSTSPSPTPEPQTPSVTSKSEPIVPRASTPEASVREENTETVVPALEPPPGPTPGTMSCPKCEFVQPVADCCEACGIVVLKYLQRQAADREQSTAPSGDDETDKETDLEPLRSIFPDNQAPHSFPVTPSTEKTSQSANPPFTRVLARSWHLIQERSGPLLILWPVTALVVCAFFAYHADLSLRFTAPYPSLTITLCVLLVLAWAWNTTLFLFADTYLSFKQGLILGLIKLPAFLWLHFWLGTILTGASLGLIVPGYLFSRWFCLTPFCFAAEQTKGLTCLLRSRAYSLGREKTLGRQLWPVIMLLLAALLGLALLPGYWKTLILFAIAPCLALLGILYRDAATSRPSLSYENTLAQRIQWPAFSLAGLLVFMIAALLLLGAGRIRSSVYLFALQAELVPTDEQHIDTPQAVRPTIDSGVFELTIEGYKAFAYINGEKIHEFPGGVYKRRTYSSPIKLKPGRNILAIRYVALEGVPHPEMTFRVFRWDLKSLQDENLGKWQITNQQGLRRVEFHLSRPASH